MKPFEPHPLLTNAHAQTLAATFLPRQFPRLPQSTPREFEVEPGTRIRGDCHWQAAASERPTLVLVHGLEGSSDSSYILGLAERAWIAGWNAVRLNQRNCGGTESLTPTLYNSGLSCDYRAVLLELVERDGLREIFFAGYSMGGNLVLKMAGDFGDAAPRELRGVAGVCPTIDLAACADAISLPKNFLYEWHFVRNLKRRIRRKAELYPGKFDLAPLPSVHTVREFDQAITAKYCGFRDADDYYAQSSALRIAAQIRVPALILTAQDDPFVPFASFLSPAVQSNPDIQLVAPEHGGHCAFVSRHPGEGRYWAEAYLMDFFESHATRVAVPIAHVLPGASPTSTCTEKFAVSQAFSRKRFDFVLFVDPPRCKKAANRYSFSEYPIKDVYVIVHRARAPENTGKHRFSKTPPTRKNVNGHWGQIPLAYGPGFCSW